MTKSCILGKILCDLFNSDFELDKKAGFNVIPNSCCYETRILVLTFINRRDHHRKILKSIYMNILILDLNNQN